MPKLTAHLSEPRANLLLRSHGQQGGAGHADKGDGGKGGQLLPAPPAEKAVSRQNELCQGCCHKAHHGRAPCHRLKAVHGVLCTATL